MLLTFLRRPETLELDSAERAKRSEGTKRLVAEEGTRSVIVWESFKNYRRSIMAKLEKRMTLHSYFMCWRVATPKFVGATVQDLELNDD